MRVHRAGEEIAVGVDQVADANQVVIEVTEVPLVLGRHAREDTHAREEGGEHVSLRCDDLAQRHEGALHVEQLAELFVGRQLEDRVFDLVDTVVEPGEHREEGVDQRVDDEVQDRDLRWRQRRRAVTCHPASDGVQHVARAPMDGHHMLR